MDVIPGVGTVERNVNGTPYTCVAHLEATLTQPWVGTNRFETAAWYETVRCEPQTITVPVWDLWGKRWATVAFTGTVVESHFPTLLGGVPMAPGPDDAGRPATWALHLSAESFSRDGHPSLPITWHVL